MLNAHGLVDQSPASYADELGSALSGSRFFSFFFFAFFFLI